MDRDLAIKKILDIEWPMFSGVKNAGGKASCQMDPDTFRIMRTSQYNTWGDDLLESYLADLEAAHAQGRNIMSEKYARMMERTFPEEYVNLADKLPPVDPAASRLVDDIVATHLQWKQDLDNRYPFLGDRGRPLYSSEDRKYSIPSLETYMRSELRCLSPKTIGLYHAETMRRKAEGQSEAEENLLNQVRQYGFENLDAANNYFAAR